MTNQYSYVESFSGKKPELPKKKIAESNISSAAKVYMLSRMQDNGAAKNYRSGKANGQSYMTGEDFVTYFQNRGKTTARPENVAKSTVSKAEIYRSKPETNSSTVSGASTGKYTKAPSRPSYGAPNVSASVKISKPKQTEEATKMFDKIDEDVKIYTPKKSASEAADVKVYAPKKSVKDETIFFNKKPNTKIEKIKSTVNEWIPEDKIVNAKKQKNVRPLSRMILAIAGITVSLMLIVSGSVLVSGTNREIKDLENELRDLSVIENELKLDLEMKNDVNVLLDRAKGDLGMIRKEYVEANYLDMSGSDKVEIYEDEKDNGIGIAAILSAFGFGG